MTLAGLADLGTLFDSGTLSGLGDEALLDRFVANGDQAAFAMIVERHGPMVLAVCRRKLRDCNDIDDAYQATFLILIKKASTLKRPGLLGPWLHGVTLRVATRAAVLGTKQRKFGFDLTAVAAAQTLPPYFQPELDEEVARLPEALRLPIILCHLEGNSYQEAAQKLQWSEATLRGRLARGRERLRDRLGRRGVMDSPIALIPGVPFKQVDSAMRLAQGVLHIMLLGKLKVTASILLAVGLISAMSLGTALPIPAPPQAPVPLKVEPPPDLSMVRQRIKAYWDGINTIAFSESVFSVDAEKKFEDSEWRLRFEFAWANGGKFACVYKGRDVDGRSFTMLKKRWDGKFLYQDILEDLDQGGVRFIQKSDQEKPIERYHGEMSALLWLISPTSPLVHLPIRPLDQGSSLRVETDTAGAHHVMFVSDDDSKIRCELDPEHDWLPKQLVLGHNLYTVTKFQRITDRWFPVEGTQTIQVAATTQDQPETYRTQRFHALDLKINEPIDDVVFNPSGTPGVAIIPRLLETPFRKHGGLGP